MRLIPSETALVLGGGGAKGAYQVGVMEALGELGVACGSVYGASIGALNAALYAQGNLETAAELWAQFRLSDLISPQSLALADSAEEIFDHPEKLLEFFSRNAQHKGIDIAPFQNTLQRYVREDAVRASRIHYGLVTTRFPKLTMVEKRLEEMEAGSLHAWITASCACFPVLPMASIGEDRYIDGGFCDNTPVEMAVRCGARQIIAVDIGRNPSHLHYARRPNITYIRTSHALGGLLAFDPAVSQRNRILGRLDTLRAFGQLRGTHYSFDPHDALMLYSRAQDFVVRLTQAETRLQAHNALLRQGNAAPLFGELEEALSPRADEIDYFLRACELCAQIAQINPAQVLTFQTLQDELRAHLPLEKAEAMLGSLLGGRIGVLFSSPQPDRRLVIACLYHLLQRENAFPSLAMHTLAAFPREMLCALTLKEIL